MTRASRRGQVDVDAEDVGGFLGADGDLAPGMLAAGLADADVILAQPLGESVGDVVQVRQQSTARSATARSAKSMAWSGGTLPTGRAASRACTSSAESHSAAPARPR